MSMRPTDVRKHRRALLTYAFVSDTLEESNDFFLGIAPIFSIIAAELNGNTFNADSFSREIEQEFGLRIPPDACEHLAPRLHKLNLMERRIVKGESIYFWANPSDTDSISDSENESQLNEIIDLFVDYCQNFQSLFSLEYDREKVEEILFDFIVAQDKDLSDAHNILLDESAHQEFDSSSEEEYICARFIASLKEEDPIKLEFLADIANAALISEVIIDLGEGKRSNINNTNCYAYIDAPLMMDYIGLSGPDYREYAVNVIDGLRELGANVSILEYSVEEIRDILFAIEKADYRDRRGPTVDAIRANQVDEKFVAYVMHNVEEAVEETGIPILNSPESTLTVQQRGYATDEDRDFLYQKLHSHYIRGKALDRDINSILFVIARRAGKSATSFLRSSHVLITRNKLLPIVSRQLIEENKGIPRFRIPPAELISKISAAIWLELGSSKRGSISRAKLVAACSRVVRVKPEIVERLRSTLARVVPENADQFEAMIHQPRMLRLAMDLTIGDERRISDKTALEAFDALKTSLVAEERQESARKAQAERKKHRDEVKRKQDQLELSDARASAAEEARISAGQNYALSRIVKWQKISNFVPWFVFISLLILTILSSLNLNIYFTILSATIMFGFSFFEFGFRYFRTKILKYGEQKIMNEMRRLKLILPADGLKFKYKPTRSVIVDKQI
ncbi:MAG: hypothetical protein H6878_03110 [Rhodobiaceae bacterium]|nr:hypothetical protein [Rhodobiaceae bacterium]MCC0053486.1 hypothetical protein [Rhodobiaceae bacterium]